MHEHVKAWAGGILAVAALAALPQAAASQAVTVPADATRHVYTFQGDRLEIQVVDVPEGSLRLLRGARGELQVVGRAPDGLAGAGLERDDGAARLNLGAVGADRGLFLVVVPSDAIVRVRLADGGAFRTFDPPRATATYEWPTRAGADAVGREETEEGDDPREPEARDDRRDPENAGEDRPER